MPPSSFFRLPFCTVSYLPHKPCRMISGISTDRGRTVWSKEYEPDGWGDHASEYLELTNERFGEYAKEALKLANLKDPSRKKILDVGAGTGAFTLIAAKAGFQVLATDFSEGMLKILSKQREETQLKFDVQQMDGQNLTLPDHHFDGVFAMFSIMFFPDQDRGIREMFRVLKPGGVGVIGAWSKDKIEWIKWSNKAILTVKPDLPRPQGVPLVYSLSDHQIFSEKMQRAGFQQVELIPILKTFTIESPKRFFRHLSSSFPAIQQTLSTYFSEAERKSVEETFEKLLKEKFGEKPIQLSGEALLGIGKK